MQKILFRKSNLVILSFLLVITFATIFSFKKNSENYVSDFFIEFATLKDQENWSKIVELGNQALLQDKIDNFDKILILLRLASSHFYLGNIQEAANKSEQALKLASIIDDPNYIARSSYVMSASYRRLSRLSNDPNDKEKYKNKSFEVINNALEFIQKREVSNFNKSKIYFNAGAAEQDLLGNSDKAIEYYNKSMKVLEDDIQFIDEFQKVNIRYIRALLDNNKLDEAELLLRYLSKDIKKGSKNDVHFLIISSKIEIAKKNYKEACEILQKAHKLAEQKKMKVDLVTVDNLIDATEKVLKK